MVSDERSNFDGLRRMGVVFEGPFNQDYWTMDVGKKGEESRLKRIDEWLDNAYDFWNPILKIGCRMSVSGFENIPKEGPVLILPNHQSYLDIPVQGVTIQNGGKRVGPMGRYGYWVMKDSLPKWLDYMGAVRIGRGNEYKKKLQIEKKMHKKELDGRIISEVEYKERLAASKIRLRAENDLLNQEAFDHIEDVYNAGEVLVSHLEGTRTKVWGKLGKFYDTILNYTGEISEKNGYDIPIVPFGIEYGPLYKINVRIGEPRSFSEDGLLMKIREDIKLLSNSRD